MSINLENSAVTIGLKMSVLIPIPKKKKCKKAKWLSEEALQIAEKRREAKGKGERERYTPTECIVPKNSKEKEESLPK